MNVFEAMDTALDLVPMTYPRRSELVAEVYDFKTQSPEADPTFEEARECFAYYLGVVGNVAWKQKIREILEG